MACGHPRACAIEYDMCTHERHDNLPPVPECTACEREAAAVEAAREECALVAESEPPVWSLCCGSEASLLHTRGIAKKIRALNVTGALDRLRVEIREQTLEECAKYGLAKAGELGQGTFARMLKEHDDRLIAGAYLAAQRECAIVRDSTVKCIDPCTEDWIAQRIGMLTPADARRALSRAVNEARLEGLRCGEGLREPLRTRCRKRAIAELKAALEKP